MCQLIVLLKYKVHYFYLLEAYECTKDSSKTDPPKPKTDPPKPKTVPPKPKTEPPQPQPAPKADPYVFLTLYLTIDCTFTIVYSPFCFISDHEIVAAV